MNGDAEEPKAGPESHGRPSYTQGVSLARMILTIMSVCVGIYFVSLVNSGRNISSFPTMETGSYTLLTRANLWWLLLTTVLPVLLLWIPSRLGKDLETRIGIAIGLMLLGIFGFLLDPMTTTIKASGVIVMSTS